MIMARQRSAMKGAVAETASPSVSGLRVNGFEVDVKPLALTPRRDDYDKRPVRKPIAEYSIDIISAFAPDIAQRTAGIAPPRSRLNDDPESHGALSPACENSLTLATSSGAVKTPAPGEQTTPCSASMPHMLAQVAKLDHNSADPAGLPPRRTERRAGRRSLRQRRRRRP